MAMGRPWGIRGSPADCAWVVRGLPMGCAWELVACPWVVGGVSVGRT